MAKLEYKDKIKQSLNELVISPLQNIVVQFIQVVQLYGTQTRDWTRQVPGVFQIQPYTVGCGLEWGNFVEFFEDGKLGSEIVWTKRVGKVFRVKLEGKKVAQAVSQFAPTDHLILTVDEQNWGFKLDKDLVYARCLPAYICHHFPLCLGSCE